MSFRHILVSGVIATLAVTPVSFVVSLVSAGPVMAERGDGPRGWTRPDFPGGGHNPSRGFRPDVFPPGVAFPKPGHGHGRPQPPAPVEPEEPPDDGLDGTPPVEG